MKAATKIDMKKLVAALQAEWNKAIRDSLVADLESARKRLEADQAHWEAEEVRPLGSNESYIQRSRSVAEAKSAAFRSNNLNSELEKRLLEQDDRRPQAIPLGLICRGLGLPFDEARGLIERAALSGEIELLTMVGPATPDDMSLPVRGYVRASIPTGQALDSQLSDEAQRAVTVLRSLNPEQFSTAVAALQ